MKKPVDGGTAVALGTAAGGPESTCDVITNVSCTVRVLRRDYNYLDRFLYLLN